MHFGWCQQEHLFPSPCEDFRGCWLYYFCMSEPRPPVLHTLHSIQEGAGPGFNSSPCAAARSPAITSSISDRDHYLILPFVSSLKTFISHIFYYFSPLCVHKVLFSFTFLYFGKIFSLRWKDMSGSCYPTVQECNQE